MIYQNIFELIKSEESNYSKPVEVIDGYQFSLKEHIRRATLYMISQFAKDNDKRDNTPFKNIVRYILNVQFRTEGFNVQDINFYIDNPEKYHKSYLIRKFHERWARENQIDKFIDEMIESATIYGLALIKNVKGIKPEVVELTKLAFADQKDILSRPFGILHHLSQEELMDMADSGWGDSDKGATISLDEFLQVTKEQQKENDGNVKVYEVHGTMPESWLGNDSKKFVRQVQIVGFYKSQNNDEVGVTLFKTKAPKQLFKVLKRDDVANRSAGFGGVEELFDAQVWTNYAMIRKRDFLDSASKTLLKTTDPTLVSKHPTGMKGLDNLEIVEVAEGKDVSQIDTFPRNFQVFNNSVDEWEEHGKKIGAATDPLLGEVAPSGTPFRAQERQVIEGKGIHEYRKEKYARFVEEVYREWIVPHLSSEIVKGKRFISELDSDVLMKLAENVAISRANKVFTEKVLDGKLVTKAELEALKERTKQDFLRQGKERFLEILKDEMKGAELEVHVDIAGKNKNLAQFAEKLTSLIAPILQNPDGFARIMQIPAAAAAFNKMIEASGLSPIEFSELMKGIPAQTGQPAGGAVETPAVPAGIVA